MDRGVEKKGRCCSEESNLARREEILETATRLFAENGFSDAMTQALAERLGVGKGTIYRHFPSKRDLFLAAADRVMRKMQEAINARVSGIEDGLERVEHGIEAFLKFFAENPDYVELLIQERAYFKDRKRPTYFEHRDINVERWRQLYREMIVQGRLRPLPVEWITNVVSNVLYGIMVTNFFNGETKPPDVQARELMDVIFVGALSDSERRAGSGRFAVGTAGPGGSPRSERPDHGRWGGVGSDESALGTGGPDGVGVGRAGGHGV